LANISRNSFVESKRYDKVILQQGVPITDYDFNEAQDIQRFKLRRSIKELLGNGAIGNGFKVTPQPAPNKTVVVKSGSLYAEGYRIVQDADVTLTVPNPSTGTKTYQIYVEVTEVEVDSTTDPDIVHPKLSIEPTRRIKVLSSVTIGETVPINTQTHYYYGIAEVTVASGFTAISSSNIKDKRHIKVELDFHTNDKNNPHGVTPQQIGAMPKGPLTWNQIEGK
jgi:hypothetical protein